WTGPVRHAPEARADARAATSPWPQTIRENGPAREKRQMRRRVSGSVSRRQSNRRKANRQGVCSLLFSFCQQQRAPSLFGVNFVTYLEAMRFNQLLCPSPKGLYCPPGDFYIDPVRPVERALITHGHSDHARSGHTHVLATRETLDIMALRYGANFAEATQPISLGESLTINGVRISF